MIAGRDRCIHLAAGASREATSPGEAQVTWNVPQCRHWSTIGNQAVSIPDPRDDGEHAKGSTTYIDQLCKLDG